MGALKHHNEALLAKWGWPFIVEPQALWKRVILSIHGSNYFGWHTASKYALSLRSPWMSISKI